MSDELKEGAKTSKLKPLNSNVDGEIINPVAGKQDTMPDNPDPMSDMQGPIPEKDSKNDSKDSPVTSKTAKEKIAEYLKKPKQSDTIVQRSKGNNFVSIRTGVVYVPVTLFD